MPTSSTPVTPGPTSRNFISQRLRLHYVDWGNPKAPPLLLLHGGRDHCRSWDWVASRLASRYHVIAPDLRGHGDSEWCNGSTYMTPGYIYDLAQLIHQQKLAPVTIIAHSLGGNVAVRYTGLYPDNVARLICVEGLGQTHNPERAKKSMIERTLQWITDSRALAGNLPRRYPTLEEAVQRMKDANKRLSDAQAEHLTVHGIRQNEDGTFCWKFDPYVRPFPPYDITRDDVESLWTRITCPVLLMWGTESWHTNPEADGRAKLFANVRVAAFEGAGHWVHHDRLEQFMTEVERFLAEG